MKKHLSTIALAVALLAGAGCQKTEQVAPLSPADKNARLSATTTTPSNCDVINFTGATGILTSVNSQNGVAIGIESYSPQQINGTNVQDDVAIVFNTANPHPEDEDLRTPTANNNVSLGNIVVVHDFTYTTSTPNDADFNGAWIEFTFPTPVTVNSIQAIDLESDEQESAFVVLYDVNGNQIGSPKAIISTIPNGVSTTNLGATQGVKTVRILVNGSIGFDNLQFCVPTTPPTNNCSYTQGYWKTHGPEAKGNNKNEWDVTSLMLGTITYSASQLQQIFNTAVAGNGLISLAHQLIAAKLNIANGSNPSTISQTIIQADALIGSKNILNGGYLSPNSVSSLVQTLTQYNEGTLPGGPKHCD